MVAEKQSCSPENLHGVAAELRKLADQIESGKVTVGGITLTVCNAVSLKMKQKLVGDQVKFDVSLVASLAGEGLDSAESSPLHEQKRSPKGVEKAPKTRPYEIKKIKKTMAQQWKQICNDIGAEKKTDPIIQADFLKNCTDYGLRAEDEWYPLWQESMSAIEQVFRLSQEGDFKGASALLTTINNQKKSCHKKFK